MTKVIDWECVLENKNSWAFSIACEELEIRRICKWVSDKQRFLLTHVEGAACAIKQQLFDEIARKYHRSMDRGQNWDALQEDLAELEWLPANAYVMVIGNADKVLEVDGEKAFSTFIAVLSHVVRDRLQDTDDSVSKTFKVIFHSTPERFDLFKSRIEKAMSVRPDLNDLRISRLELK